MTPIPLELEPRSDPDFIIASDIMRKFMAMVERVAHHVGTVLITGETGTGKERIARCIHDYSLRSEQPFVDINCAALPEHLVESELFGYEKGAFSGADSAKPGLFELANKGTIFLDEIGELDLRVQVKLLRVLDRAPYYRLGGHRKITADTRVVAATNRNLKEEVRAGRFRKDLYHRLSQFELSVPPLRDRPEDITAIARHLLSTINPGMTFSSGALQVLRSYTWPGNVRELQNVINKVVFSSEASILNSAEVSRELTNFDGYSEVEPESPQILGRPDTHKAQAIQQALKDTGGHRGQAAVQLGISRRTLSRKLRDYGLSSARSAAPLAAASLHEEARQHFRAELRVPAVLVTSDGTELSCTTNNLGTSGMGLEGLNTLLAYRARLRLRFQFPDTAEQIEAMATLAWADKHGCAGVVFTDNPASMNQQISEWLQQKLIEENWTASSLPVPAPEADAMSTPVPAEYV